MEREIDMSLLEEEVSVQDSLRVYLYGYELFDYLTEFQSIRELGFWVLCKGLGVSTKELGQWYKRKFGKPYSQLKNTYGWFCLEDGRGLSKREALAIIKDALKYG